MAYSNRRLNKLAGKGKLPYALVLSWKRENGYDPVVWLSRGVHIQNLSLSLSLAPFLLAVAFVVPGLELGRSALAVAVSVYVIGIIRLAVLLKGRPNIEKEKDFGDNLNYFLLLTRMELKDCESWPLERFVSVARDLLVDKAVDLLKLGADFDPEIPREGWTREYSRSIKRMRNTQDCIRMLGLLEGTEDYVEKAKQVIAEAKQSRTVSAA